MRNPLARHFENLLHLQAVVDAGSINRAATVIGLSQPALTRSIGRLEAAVGVQLLTRVAKGVYPTESGRALLDHLRAADAELERAATALRILRSRAGSQVACGGTYVPMCFLVPLAVKAFNEVRAAANVRLVEGSTDALLRMLRLGELDIVVCPKMDALSDDGLLGETLVTEHVGIFAHSRHKLLDGEQSLRKLAAGEKWIVPDRSGQLRQLLIREFARHSVDLPNRYVETSSLTAARRLVTVAGLIAFSTSLVLAEDLLAGTTRELRGDWQFPGTTITLFHREGALPPAAASFVECLRRAAATVELPADTPSHGAYASP